MVRAMASQRSYKSEYQRRIQKGLVRGLSSREAAGHKTKPAKAWQTQLPGVHNRPAYRRATEALSYMRAEGLSLSKAASKARASPDAVLRYAGSALKRDSKGRWAPKPLDHLYRSMAFYTPEGLVYVEPANSKEARKLAEYMNAVKRYMETGDDRMLRKFRGKMLRLRNKTYIPLLTDQEALKRLAEAGELSFEDIYEEVT